MDYPHFWRLNFRFNTLFYFRLANEDHFSLIYRENNNMHCDKKVN